MENMRKPEWLKVKYNRDSIAEVAQLMNEFSLNTVCKEAHCPNMGECFNKRTATFMIMGANCTRNCRFCNVTCAKPTDLDPDEPMRVAMASKKLGLKYVVVTSVTRDDLPDEGAEHFAQTITAIRKEIPDAKIEVLIPDMHAKPENLDVVLKAAPDVLNHNVETIERLYKEVRPQAIYERSLEVLRYSKENYPDIFTKTGIMVGLGETEEEVLKLMDDLLAVNCDIMTIGQYMRPSFEHIPVVEYVEPKQFDRYKELGEEKGFKYIASSPLVRSSYKAQEALEAKAR